MLTVDLFNQLLTPTGQAALALAQAGDLRPEQRLRTITELRRELPADLATAALEMAVLRVHARTKWPDGDRLYWTRAALEQASGAAVGQHRAQRFLPWTSAADLCCSVGGDLLPLAAAGLQVTGVDQDPLRLAMAAANAEVYGVSARVNLVLGDVTTQPLPAVPVLFFDPARRDGDRRLYDPASYNPPLQTINAWLPQVAGLGVKVAPGIDYSHLPWPCEVEVVSVRGEVKEAVLWFGAFQQTTRRATLLPGGSELVFRPVPPVAITPPQAYLYEPDGAVIRAHLIEQLATDLGAAKIDEDIAFLTTSDYQPTPLARAFVIHETLPFNLKQLRARLRALNVGHVVVKKRGSPIDPQQLEKQLRLVGEGSITVVLTQAAGRPIALLCEPLPEPANPTAT